MPARERTDLTNNCFVTLPLVFSVEHPIVPHTHIDAFLNPLGVPSVLDLLTG